MGCSGDSHYHLFSTEKGVTDELARAQRYGLVGHGCGVLKGVRTSSRGLMACRALLLGDESGFRRRDTIRKGCGLLIRLVR